MIFCGIDYGSKKIGMAFSDENGLMAFPHSVVKNNSVAKDIIKKLLKEKNVDTIVFGKSLNQSGGENLIAKETEIFANMLQKETGVPVAFVIESFSTVHARGLPGKDILHSSYKSTKEINDIKDAESATLILERFLEKKKRK